MTGSYVPFLKVVGSTLARSSEILVRHSFGRLSPQAVDAIFARWAQSVFAAGNGTVEGFGLEHIQPGQAYVVMTNHQSLLDIPAVMLTFPGRIRMVGKKELANVPIWGGAMRAAGNVFVSRDGGRDQARASLEGAKARLREGASVWIAPEGTRSRDGNLQRFKKGGFHVAMQLGVPLLPGFVDGTREVIAPDSFRVRPGGHVTVRYGAPIATDGVDDAGIPALMEQVRQALEGLRAAGDRP